MAYEGFKPDEVVLLARLLGEAITEARKRGLVIPDHVMARRLLHEAHRKGFGDLERLKSIALGEGVMTDLRVKWSGAMQGASCWLRERGELRRRRSSPLES